MSDISKINETGKCEDLWNEKYIDLNQNVLIDYQVAMIEPSAKKIRGRCFSPADRQKVSGQVKKMI